MNHRYRKQDCPAFFFYQLLISQVEHALIDRALSKCGGVKTRAADFLGINRNTLNKKVKDLGIEAVE